MIIAGCRLEGRSGHDAGWQLLKKLYFMETGKALPPVTVTPRGKPHFADGKYHFSITHTPRHALCALSRYPVGIDAEELGRPLRETLVQRVLSESELRQYREADDRNRAFLTFWVLKEAQAKYSGQGLQGFPNGTRFRLEDPRVTEWDGCLFAAVSTGEDEGVTFYAF